MTFQSEIINYYSLFLLLQLYWYQFQCCNCRIVWDTLGCVCNLFEKFQTPALITTPPHTTQHNTSHHHHHHPSLLLLSLHPPHLPHHPPHLSLPLPHLTPLLPLSSTTQDDRFNDEVDARTGYKTRSLLCLPVTDAGGEVIGVAQVRGWDV